MSLPVTYASAPRERYVRNERIGHGAYKTVYSAIDRERGISVAWNEIELQGDVDVSKLAQELELLGRLRSEYIMELYESWIDERELKLIFISELMTSGSLRSFVQKAQRVAQSVVRDWTRQILAGLVYLHAQNPPIIHRDIKLDNIFFHGTTGRVKIGDLGLATVYNTRSQARMSVIGTPEFMAPEFYVERYDVKVDIWAFGLCLIEMVTLEYPYAECSNVASLFRTVSQGLRPAALARIATVALLEFVACALESDPQQRLSASELLAHPWLSAPEPREGEPRYVRLYSEDELCAVKAEIGNTAQGWDAYLTRLTAPIRASPAHAAVFASRTPRAAPATAPPTPLPTALLELTHTPAFVPIAPSPHSSSLPMVTNGAIPPVAPPTATEAPSPATEAPPPATPTSTQTPLTTSHPAATDAAPPALPSPSLQRRSPSSLRREQLRAPSPPLPIPATPPQRRTGAMASSMSPQDEVIMTPTKGVQGDSDDEVIKSEPDHSPNASDAEADDAPFAMDEDDVVLVSPAARKTRSPHAAPPRLPRSAPFARARALSEGDDELISEHSSDDRERAHTQPGGDEGEDEVLHSPPHSPTKRPAVLNYHARTSAGAHTRAYTHTSAPSTTAATTTGAEDGVVHLKVAVSVPDGVARTFLVDFHTAPGADSAALAASRVLTQLQLDPSVAVAVREQIRAQIEVGLRRHSLNAEFNTHPRPAPAQPQPLAASHEAHTLRHSRMARTGSEEGDVVLDAPARTLPVTPMQSLDDAFNLLQGSHGSTNSHEGSAGVHHTRRRSTLGAQSVPGAQHVQQDALRKAHEQELRRLEEQRAALQRKHARELEALQQQPPPPRPHQPPPAHHTSAPMAVPIPLHSGTFSLDLSGSLPKSSPFTTGLVSPRRGHARLAALEDDGDVVIRTSTPSALIRTDHDTTGTMGVTGGLGMATFVTPVTADVTPAPSSSLSSTGSAGKAQSLTQPLEMRHVAPTPLAYSKLSQSVPSYPPDWAAVHRPTPQSLAPLSTRPASPQQPPRLSAVHEGATSSANTSAELLQREETRLEPHT